MRAITQKALSKVHQTSDPMKQIKEQVGNVNDLQTNAKGSVVDAANELLRRLIVTDTCGVIGNEGEEVEAQALIDEIADKVMEKLLLKTGDSADNIVKFESGDNVKAQSWTDVDVMETKEKHKSLFEKISTMFKNVRFLYKLLGTTDISTIKDGTVTGILNALDNVAFTGIYADLHNKPLALPASDVYTWAKQATKPAYTKSEVGLGNANNTSDKDKPVSTAQQTALDKKVNFTDISRSTAVNVAGKKALDAIEKNASVDGTLAHDISQIYSNLSGKEYNFTYADGFSDADANWTTRAYRHGNIVIMRINCKCNSDITGYVPLLYINTTTYNTMVPYVSESFTCGRFIIGGNKVAIEGVNIKAGSWIRGCIITFI